MKKITALVLILILSSAHADGDKGLVQEVFWASILKFNAEKTITLFHESLQADHELLKSLSAEDRQLIDQWKKHQREYPVSLSWDEDKELFKVKIANTETYLSVASFHPYIVRINFNDISFGERPTLSSIVETLQRNQALQTHRSNPTDLLINQANAFAPLLAVPGLAIAGWVLYTVYLGNGTAEVYSDSDTYLEHMRRLRLRCQDDLNHLQSTEVGRENSDEGLIAAHELRRIADEVKQTLQRENRLQDYERIQSCSEIGRQMTSTISVFRELGQGRMIEGDYARSMTQGCEEFKEFLSCMDQMSQEGERRGLTHNSRRMRYKGLFGGVRTDSEYQGIIEFYRTRARGVSR